jgi:hypothetical protein
MSQGHRMKIKSLHPVSNRSAAKSPKRSKKSFVPTAPSRLDSVEAADMPWLAESAHGVFSETPEVSGPAEYRKPAGWS